MLCLCYVYVMFMLCLCLCYVMLCLCLCLYARITFVRVYICLYAYICTYIGACGSLAEPRGSLAEPRRSLAEASRSLAEASRSLAKPRRSRSECCEASRSSQSLAKASRKPRGASQNVQLSAFAHNFEVVVPNLNVSFLQLGRNIGLCTSYISTKTTGKLCFVAAGLAGQPG